MNNATTTLTVTSPLGTREHTFRGPRAAKLAAYWAAYLRGLGYDVR